MSANRDLSHAGIDPTAATIVPTLPMDDPDFREITSDFLDRLPIRLEKIENAIEAANYPAVHADAHWLKGAGGTVGYDVLTQPTRNLIAAAGSGESDVCLQCIERIESIRNRLIVPEGRPV